MSIPERKSIRLPLERYADTGSIWHLTMATDRRRPIFENDTLSNELIESLKTACTKGGADLLIYCAMDDHLHAVVQVLEADLISILRNYKSFSTRTWWKHGGAGALWQRSAYDRGIRGEVYLDRVLAYV
jgi:REP element-mobilizing transposase RayT